MPDFCWRSIGVGGDGSCERLPELVHCRNCAEYARAGRSLFDRPAPEGAGEECARELAAPPPASLGEMLSVVVFRVEGEWFALPTALFREAAEPRGIHTVPGRSNRIFRGLANVNGELLLTFSLAGAADLAQSADRAGCRRLCVIGRASERIVFEAAEVLGVRRIPSGALDAPPATVARSPGALVRAVFQGDGRAVALLDEEKLLARFQGSLA